ncbi:hypothetical protein BX283_6292 [Streptomyces sp. TLI_146]|nr:hypothetical protein BX283_6292 [Streptomyces sp. TLI_146]
MTAPPLSLLTFPVRSASTTSPVNADGFTSSPSPVSAYESSPAREDDRTYTPLLVSGGGCSPDLDTELSARRSDVRRPMANPPLRQQSIITIFCGATHSSSASLRNPALTPVAATRS